MKTFAAAALLAALTLSAAAGQQKGQPDETQTVKTPPAKPAGQKVTIEDVGRMLEGLGLEPEPLKNDDGKVETYRITFPSDNWKIVAYVDLSPNGQYIWLWCTLVSKVDAATPAEAMLAALETNRANFPGFVTYMPKWKTIRLEYPVAVAGLTPAALKKGIDGYAEAVKRTLPAWEKAEAVGKDRKAEGQEQK